VDARNKSGHDESGVLVLKEMTMPADPLSLPLVEIARDLREVRGT